MGVNRRNEEKQEKAGQEQSLQDFLSSPAPLSSSSWLFPSSCSHFPQPVYRYHLHHPAKVPRAIPKAVEYTGGNDFTHMREPTQVTAGGEAVPSHTFQTLP